VEPLRRYALSGEEWGFLAWGCVSRGVEVSIYIGVGSGDSHVCTSFLDIKNLWYG
jgi:hypothetical protein